MRQVASGLDVRLQGPTDAVLGRAGITHVTTQLAARGDEQSVRRASEAMADTAWAPHQHRIDHIASRGMPTRDTAVAEVQRGEYPGHATDHHGLVWDTQ